MSTQLDRIEAMLNDALPILRTLAERKQSRSAAGRKSKRELKQMEHDVAVASAKFTLTQQTSTEWQEAWRRYTNWRRDGVTMTVESVKRILKRMVDWSHDEQIDALHNSADNEWKNVYKPKESEGQPREEWG